MSTGNASKQLNILISGAGIAGLVAAHFLLRGGHAVTIVERAPELRTSGQSVDVRGHALTILQRMKSTDFDAEEAVRAKTTKEKGLRFVDAANHVQAEFPVDDGTAFTSEIEIMRGDLANVLFDSVRNMPGCDVIFDGMIQATDQAKSGGVVVKLKGRWPNLADPSAGRHFDLVIVADGISSSTRSLAFDSAVGDGVKPLGQWSCWFSIPQKDTDSQWARWYNAPGGRMILIRPDNSKLTRVSLWTMTRDPKIEKVLTTLLTAHVDEQKDFWAKLFQAAGWEGQRVLEGMETADDFYMQKIAQVKLDSWSTGNVVLVGDAAYCPSPISGMGVTTAMTGAYVLAGEVNSNPSDLPAAVKAYEEKMRPFVTVAQHLAPGTPGAANPDSAWGIWFLHCLLAFVAWSKLYKLFGSSVNPPSQAMTLPDYRQATG